MGDLLDCQFWLIYQQVMRHFEASLQDVGMWRIARTLACYSKFNVLWFGQIQFIKRCRVPQKLICRSQQFRGRLHLYRKATPKRYLRERRPFDGQDEKLGEFVDVDIPRTVPPDPR